MLTTIQELENEIEQFHKNIKDSNELMNILMSVVSLLKTQTNSFDVRASDLQNELTKLPPELSETFQEKIEIFIQQVQQEHQLYQNSIASLMDDYSDRVLETETAIKNIPVKLEEQLQNNNANTVKGLKQIQEQYADELKETNKSFSDKLQAVLGEIQVIPMQLKDDSAQQYKAFLNEMKNLMDARIEQLSKTENHVLDLSKGLETKYNAFITKLETTNMDQLYKYCQDMNKSINTKLGFILGGVGVAVVISIISLMF